MGHLALDGALEVTFDVLHAVADGMSTEDAVCSCLAHRFDAVIAAYVALDPSTGTARVVAWPSSLDVGQIRALLDQLSTSAAASSGVLCCGDLVHLPLEVPGTGRRLVVLGRTQRFGADAVALLEAVRGPLTDVVRVAGERPLPVVEGEPAHGLTGREVEVLRLVAQGLLARTIALRLEVSPRTVHKHLGSIYRKLDAHDRLVAVRRAEALGLVTPAASQGW